MKCLWFIESKAFEKSTAINAPYDPLSDTASIANWIFHEISDFLLTFKKPFCSLPSFLFEIGSICFDSTPTIILYAKFNIVIGLKCLKSVSLPFLVIGLF
uniref:Uncharacterized protein n=1 Tax=Lepeophtheirus salmonis TaxID=72036 RepID=A0A0K2V607_LEPSM